MQADWLSLTTFRSYQALEWSPDDGVNLLIGSNGAGKTNLLEAIGYLATLKSFRGAPDEALIRDGDEGAVIRSGLSSDGRDRLVEVALARAGRRRAQVDKSALRRTADLLGVVRVIAFLPEDLDLVKRGPAYRRDLLDEIAVQLWPSTYLDQAEFERALRQRNALLRSGDRDEATLGVWDARLSQSGGKVVARRLAVLSTIGPWLEELYGAIAERGDRATMSYTRSWGEGEAGPSSAAQHAAEMMEALAHARRQDFDRRMTTVGPHRDEPVFRLDGADTRTRGSQGEQRTMALAVKMAAHRAVAEVVGENPLLLLDDVFSELDPARAKALAASIPDATQTMVTSARPEDLPIAGSTWRVDEGVHR